MTRNLRKRGIVVEVKDDNISSVLRKFKRKVDDSNKLEDIKARMFYEKPTTERKRKKGAAKARWNKKLREQQLPKKQY
jgi:small subunit ribosomal protein S21